MTIGNGDGGWIALSVMVTPEVSCCGSSGGDGIQQLLVVAWHSCTRFSWCEERMSETAWFDGGCSRLEGVAAEVTSSVVAVIACGGSSGKGDVRLVFRLSMITKLASVSLCCFLPLFWGARMDGVCCSLRGVEVGVVEAPGGGCDGDCIFRSVVLH